MADPRRYRLTVAEVITETDDARSLVFEPVPFTYRPGQFLTLRIPSDRNGSVARCYSLCSSPHTDDRMRVLVKRTGGGYASNWLCDHIAAGSTIEALAPAGVFCPRSLDGDLLFCAAGSGITPVLSIMKSALFVGSGRLVLIYANRDESSVVFADELRALAEAHPGRLVVVHWLESVQGLPTTAALRALAAPFAGSEVLLCGPKPFMSAARTALAALKVPRDRIHLERFVSLGANPFERTEEPDPGDGSSTVEVELDGGRHRLPWPARTRLLDLLLDSGLPAPFSCREGACGACACRLVSGEVKMLNNDVLEQEDLDEGLILACQSLPVTDRIEISYE
ncbi:MAG TPA: ferredoxin--NADP reductase [Actinophytocola sp.]|uniref:ferredoxin--NADP reductase n=1 Tax=Actinophytocola sp. TaxID=1872138 RepID=UPI002DBFFE3D|nr:ferredoxin--NADP reductase [Actinophytocola sp.]HEU5474172.1 ferredoxin--NADP reductase [Actinophytocola sp.]